MSPARDLSVGRKAISNGADAVYIGPPAFGARKLAANSIEDIGELSEYAHRFGCKVYATMNTVLYDDELAEAERMIRELYQVGVDALIVQDMSILRMDIPPISLHASTQMHNYDLDRILFLDQLGFDRIVLARELSLDQLREIRRQVKAELEVFIHGALCVSMSGQCYMSHYLSGRSANRGNCMQACRQMWSVRDSEGTDVVRDKYVLSLKDLNMSAHIAELVTMGIDSLKIEGRLKDEGYVGNVTNYYHTLLQTACAECGVKRVGSGEVQSYFEPDPERSFNRGSSDYFAEGRHPGLANMDTPKSIGKYVGKAMDVKGNRMRVAGGEALHNGDGLCYSDGRMWRGIRLNKVEGEKVECLGNLNIPQGTPIYRNLDIQFIRTMERNPSSRKIGVRMKAVAMDGELTLRVTDEDGVEVSEKFDGRFDLAKDEGQRERFLQQLAKCGDTDFVCHGAEYEGEVLFMPMGVVNACRRRLLEELAVVRGQRWKRPMPRRVSDEFQDAGKPVWREYVDWKGNVTNAQAKLFYENHGAKEVERGLETSHPRVGMELMRTRYCLLHELGLCRKQGKAGNLHFPLYLMGSGQTFRLDFDCKACFMSVVACGDNVSA